MRVYHHFLRELNIESSNPDVALVSGHEFKFRASANWQKMVVAILAWQL